MPASPPDVAAHAGVAAMERLRRIAERGLTGEPLDPVDAEWLAVGVDRYIEGAPAGLKLDEALEVAVSPGASPWWSAQRRADRDDAIRELAGTFSGPSTSRALAAAEAMRSYGSTGWRHDRTRGAPLTSDARRKLLFKIFSVDTDPPTSMRRVYDILNSG